MQCKQVLSFGAVQCDSLDSAAIWYEWQTGASLLSYCLVLLQSLPVAFTDLCCHQVTYIHTQSPGVQAKTMIRIEKQHRMHIVIVSAAWKHEDAIA